MTKLRATPKAKGKATARAREEQRLGEAQYRGFVETARELGAVESGRPFHDLIKAIRRRQAPQRR